MNPAETGGMVVVTGAASGIGDAACRLPDTGWTEFGLDIAEARLHGVRDEFAVFQDRFRPIVCDVAAAIARAGPPIARAMADPAVAFISAGAA